MSARLALAACAGLWPWGCGEADAPALEVALDGRLAPAEGSAGPLDERAKLVLLLGQSNMVGLGLRRELAQEPAPHARVWVHAEGDVAPARAGRWLPLEVGFGRSDESFGPELSMGLALARDLPPSARVGLVKHAVGATSLAQDWAPGSALFEESLDHAQRALEEVPGGGEWVGVVWMQGERDAQEQRSADAYAERLQAWIWALRRRLGEPGLPLVVGQITRAWPYAAQVREGQARASDELPRVSAQEAGDLPLQDDLQHYTGAALWTLGERFAAALLAEHPRALSWPPQGPALQGEAGWFYLEDARAMRWDGARWVGVLGARVEGASLRAARAPVSVVWRAPASVEVLARGAWRSEGARACVLRVEALRADGLGAAAGGALAGPWRLSGGEPARFLVKRRLAQGEALVFGASAAPGGECAASLDLALEVAWDRR